jgi:hypothetical protein
MRDYSKFSPKFWTGDTSGVLRSLGRDAQVIGAYLFTCPMANMIGLYYLNLATLVDEVGHIDREGALKVLRSLSEGGYCHFDERSQTVFVVEMAKHQIGEALTRRDNRHKAVLKELEHYRKSPFFNAFLDRYAEAFQLQDVPPNKGLRRALQGAPEAPSKPGAGAGAGTGEGSEGGAGAEEKSGAGATHPVDNPVGNGSLPKAGPEDFSGQSSPPEDPQSRRNGSAERRTGDFEKINTDVSKLLATGVYTADKPSALAAALHLSTRQVETAIRQLRDRGRLPAEAA